MVFALASSHSRLIHWRRAAAKSAEHRHILLATNFIAHWRCNDARSGRPCGKAIACRGAIGDEITGGISLDHDATRRREHTTAREDRVA
jgi:hypothetical protein